MTIAAAKMFIKQAMASSEFVSRLNSLESFDEFKRVLCEEGFEFEVSDFEEAFNNLHTQCQTQEQADLLFQIKSWWDCMLSIYDRL